MTDLHPDMKAALDRVAERLQDRIAEELWRSTMPTPISDEVLRRIETTAQLPLTSMPGYITDMHLAIGGEPLGCSVNDLARELLAAREALRGLLNLASATSLRSGMSDRLRDSLARQALEHPAFVAARALLPEKADVPPS